MTETKFNFVSDASGGDQFTVVSFSGNEAISTLYQYELEIKAPLSAGIDLDDLLDSRARFVTEADGHEYPVYGVLSSIDELRTVQGYVYYQAVLVPRLWWLSIYKTNEIYCEQDQTVDDIIETVLENAGLISGTDFDLSELDDRDFLKRNYRCQFGESDFDFISRLMENEGIFYHFDHSGDIEKIIFINDLNYMDLPHPGLIFDVAAQTSQQHKSVHAWSCRKQRLASGVTVRDFNPDQPSLDISHTMPIDQMGQGTEYLYGDNICDEEEAEYLSNIRAEERLCQKTRYYGESSVTRLQSGYLFGLGGHPNENYNGVEYLTVEVSHEGMHLDMSVSAGRRASKSTPQYRNSFVAIEASEQFRPARVTAKPRFYGTMTAFIYAESTTMKAEIDEFGRYRVHLPFDRSDGTLLSTDPNRKASTWIRMAQPYVGQEQGMYFPLTGGTEVLLTFINGDPDQPIISGAVPNAAEPSLLTSEMNLQRTITTQPSQTVTGNTHVKSLNSAHIEMLENPPSAPDPVVVNCSYINEDYTNATLPTGNLPSDKSMIPPWNLKSLSEPSPAYDQDLIKFKKYNRYLTASEMQSWHLSQVSTERNGGDNYVYSNGRTFAYPQHERVYFIGTFHEDFHVKDDFITANTDGTYNSWTGVREQFNFPAPGEKFPDGTTGETHSDNQVNPKGIRGVSEDKRWGDQMNYAWGRVFNWGGGEELGSGRAGGEYNYGNGYTENLLTLTGGTSSHADFPYKSIEGWDYTAFGTPHILPTAAGYLAGIVVTGLAKIVTLDLGGAIAKAGTHIGALVTDVAASQDLLKATWQLDPACTAVEKTYGHKYEYHLGLAVAIHEGNTVEKTWGDKAEFHAGSAESLRLGDSLETTLGSTSEYFGGTKWDFTLGVTNSTMVGLAFETCLAGKFELNLAEAKDYTIIKKKEAAPAKEEITAKDLQTAIEKNTNAINDIEKSVNKEINSMMYRLTTTGLIQLKSGTVDIIGGLAVSINGSIIKAG